MGTAGDHTLVFVGGLNRSGTTILARAIAEHPLVSGFHDTPAKQDEGMHLQTVYPTMSAHGGPGAFAFRAAAHLTESSRLATPANATKLFDEWSRWWDLSCPLLVEKSPANLIQTRFLQALFPGARFVLIMRHPVPVTLATHRWRRRATLDSLLRHWIRAHDIFEEDRPHLDHVHVVRYETLIADPQACLADVHRFLGLAPHPTTAPIREDGNDAYFARWAEMAKHPLSRITRARVERRLGAAIERHGYRLDEMSPLAS